MPEVPSSPLLPTAAPTAADYGGFVYWPDNLAWSNQLMRLIGYASVGAADFSEVYFVARSLPVGDEEAWQSGFSGLAAQLDEQATKAASDGHAVTAREKWLRASTYYRFAGQLSALAGVSVPHVEDSRRCFRAATAGGVHSAEPVDVPFQGEALAGYLVRTAGNDQPAPAVIVSGGIDAFAEEMYPKIGAALARRGYTALLLDGPGQGESARRGISGRYKYESACSAAFDFLTSRAAVDSTRIAVLGASLGGYYATRAAAYEHRLAACVIWGATGNFYADVGAHLTPDSPLTAQLGQAEAYFGVTGLDSVKRALADMSLDGIPELIRCPTLILHGEKDIQIPVAAAHWTFDHIVHAPKQLLVIPGGAPGATHCQLDSPVVAQHAICDFLDHVLHTHAAETMRGGSLC